MKKQSAENLLYEIGVEEIPSDYLSRAAQSISEKAPELLIECGLSYEALNVLATPRRLVIFVKSIKKNDTALEEKLGPSKEQSYKDGQATSALLGFLKSSGQNESALTWKETPKGLRACVMFKRNVKLLRYFLETLPAKIAFPKLMRWEKTGYQFTRPIRWTFALLGSKPQKYRIGSVASGQTTRGHRFLANRTIRITKADITFYEQLLARAHVVLRPEKRLDMVRSFLKTANHVDEDLVQTVANLTEEPFAVRGTFKKEYLALPPEVLSTCMRKQQKTFACYDKNGKLINQFIAVINGKRKNTALIARNYENVLASRLEDAKFFYHEDLKTTLEFKAQKLREMIFLGKLGSYADKVMRLEKLCEFVATEIGEQPANRKCAMEAAKLCKADLVSKLVYEFPELQGIAGSEYALHDKWDPLTARSIREHYHPKSLSEDHESLKRNIGIPGAILAIADRIDLLVGALGVGIEPSGSQDPYALRRAGGGIAKLVRAFNFSFSIRELIQRATSLYGNRLTVNTDEIQKQLSAFLKERVLFELDDLRPGTKPYEIFHAVWRTRSDNLSDVYERYNVLCQFCKSKNEQFIKAAKVIERTGNILKGAKGEVGDDINASLFENQFETKLSELINRHRPDIERLTDSKEYGRALEEFANDFYAPVHDFFEKVMVNVEDVKIRANRLTLMKRVNRMVSGRIADLSLISTNP